MSSPIVFEHKRDRINYPRILALSSNISLSLWWIQGLETGRRATLRPRVRILCKLQCLVNILPPLPCATWRSPFSCLALSSCPAVSIHPLWNTSNSPVDSSLQSGQTFMRCRLALQWTVQSLNADSRTLWRSCSCSPDTANPKLSNQPIRTKLLGWGYNSTAAYLQQLHACLPLLAAFVALFFGPSLEAYKLPQLIHVFGRHLVLRGLRPAWDL